MGTTGSGAAAGPTSMMSVGLSGLSTLMQAQGTATTDQYQAEKLDTAATYGDLKAVQTGGQMTRNLNTTLGNIAAVRAAARADPNSPTGAAVIDEQETIGNQNKSIAVNSITQQANQDRSDANYYQQASSSALLAGDIGAGAGILKGVAGLKIPGLG